MPYNPGSVVVSSDFGARGGSHQGIDFDGSPGTPIAAAGAGDIVVSEKNIPGFGPTIVIVHTAPDGSKFTTWYGHLDPNSLRPIGPVSAGDTVGRIGPGIQGRSTGPHLHYETGEGTYRTGERTRLDPRAPTTDHL